MKDYIHFFVVFTLLEIVLTGLYYSVVKRIDATIVIGAGLYTCAMIAGYFSYRVALYKKQKQELLDALP